MKTMLTFSRNGASQLASRLSETILLAIGVYASAFGTAWRGADESLGGLGCVNPA